MREYLLAMVVAIVVTLLLGGPIRTLAVHFGVVGEVRERDVHKVPTPRVGGLAMFGGLVASLTLAGHFPMLHEKAYAGSNTVQALLWGSALVVLLGVVDDKWDLDPLTKFAGQIFAASVMVVKGIQITWLVLPGYGILALDPTLGIVLSVFIVLVAMNAVNFVDGLDGLAAGIVCIAGVATFAYCFRLAINYHITGAVGPALISIVTVGICVGFLGHNWSPARMFMGDTGSMLLGMLLAAQAISITGQVDPGALMQHLGQTGATHKLVPTYLPLILPVSVILLPLADMVMAVVRRTAKGQSPLAADKGHLHHRLLQIGHSPRRAVLIMYFWSALVSFVTVLIAVTPSRQPIVYGAIALTLIGLVLLLMPRLGDHRSRVGRAAKSAASVATPERWRGDTQPTARARHRAPGGRAAALGAAAPAVAGSAAGSSAAPVAPTGAAGAFGTAAPAAPSAPVSPSQQFTPVIPAIMAPPAAETDLALAKASVPVLPPVALSGLSAVAIAKQVNAGLLGPRAVAPAAPGTSGPAGAAATAAAAAGEAGDSTNTSGTAGAPGVTDLPDSPDAAAVANLAPSTSDAQAAPLADAANTGDARGAGSAGNAETTDDTADTGNAHNAHNAKRATGSDSDDLPTRHRTLSG